MHGGDPAGIHFFSFWSDRAKDEGAPLWLRLAALAYSSHTKNGHATFFITGDSNLPETVGKKRQHVQNEIRRAIELGLLAKESNINCLVLPDEICGGAKGHPHAECKLHKP